jgi:hypothetical protein
LPTVCRATATEAASSEHYDEWEDFAIAQADPTHPVTRRLHVAFVAASIDEVDAFWRAGTEAGHPSDGEPGPRPVYHEGYYGAFLLDPDGTKRRGGPPQPRVSHWSGGWRRDQRGERWTSAPTPRQAAARARYEATRSRALPLRSTS